MKCHRCGKENPAEVHTCSFLALLLADELYRHGSTNTPNTVADELVRLHNEIEATDRQVEILTDTLSECSKENAVLRGLLKEARKIIRASGARNLAKDWDQRATAALAQREKT